MATVHTADGYPAIEYETFRKFADVQHGDDVFVSVPGLPDVGEWGEVDEYSDDDTVSVRIWGESFPHEVHKDNIKFVMLHKCECGNEGPTSWPLCHPEA